LDAKLILQLTGIALGLLYLWLEYRAHIGLWLVGLVMPVVHGVLYYKAGLYADCAMNGYYVLAGLYGLIVWRRAPKSRQGGRIAPTPGVLWVQLLVVGLAVQAAIYVLLTTFTNSTVPFWDSLTTALSVVAMWMLSRKYLEQWLVWLAVDVLTVGLYLFKEIPFTAGLYALYSVLAVGGYLRWRRLMHVPPSKG
jgi:nicotinamide mononucleotide transporter pnuC